MFISDAILGKTTPEYIFLDKQYLSLISGFGGFLYVLVTVAKLVYLLLPNMLYRELIIKVFRL